MLDTGFCTITNTTKGKLPRLPFVSIKNAILGEKFEFDIVVQIITFTGAHNPPQGIETITIKTYPGETKVINFNHKPE